MARIRALEAQWKALGRRWDEIERVDYRTGSGGGGLPDFPIQVAGQVRPPVPRDEDSPEAIAA